MQQFLKHNENKRVIEKLKVMKNLNFVCIFLIGFLFVSVAVQATGVRSQYNEYEITSVEDIRVGKSIQAIWKLSYSANDAAITVLKRKSLEGTEYVVQNDYFAVAYVASADGFGVQQVKKAWTKVPRQITNAVISQTALAQQRIITPSKVDDQRALQLIASYLPELINKDYKHVLN